MFLFNPAVSEKTPLVGRNTFFSFLKGKAMKWNIMVTAFAKLHNTCMLDNMHQGLVHVLRVLI